MKTSEALQKVGSAGKYQYLLLLYMCLFRIDLAYMLIGPSYIYINPTFRCEGYDKTLEEKDACSIIDKCQLVEAHSITATAGLYCDRQFQRNLIQSSMYIGSISGLVIMNIISDKYGRKFSFMISLAVCTAGAACVTLGGFTKLVAVLVIGQIFSGFGGYSCMTITYIIISDMMSNTLRQKGIIILGVAWGAGEMSFFLLYNYLNQWYVFTIGFLLIPLMAQFAIGYFLLLESPVYLNEYSREKCVESLNKVAEWNNTQPLQADDIEINPKINDNVSAFEIFKHWPYLKCIILISLFEITNNIFFYGTQYSMQDIGYNFGLNMLIIGCLDFTASFTSIFFVHKLKRKRNMMLLNVVIGGLGALFVFNYIKESKIMQLIIVQFCRFLLSYSFGLLALFTNESFPDRVKSSGGGVIEALSNLGDLVTPFVVTLTSNTGISPVFMVSVILILGITPLIFTKETFHHIATEDAVNAEQAGLQESLITGGEVSQINQ